MYFAIPSIILIVVSLFLLRKKWWPYQWWEIIAVIIIIGIMLMLIPQLFNSVNTSGWITESVRTDELQVTTDQKYEYNIELVNIFQKNSSTRLYLKELNTSEEIRIPLNLSTTDIGMIFWEYVFVKLEETSNPDIYILYTTERSPFPGIKFEINIQKHSAIQIE